jgi:plastocyanin
MTINKEKGSRTFYASSVIATATILMAAGVAGSALLIPNQVIASIDNTIEEEERVAVGGGNITVSVNQFLPASVEIQRGESVTFYAPQNSTEVHNIIFDLSNGSIISSLELPFILPEGAGPDQLELAPPFNFGDPMIIEQPHGGEAIITLNKAAFYPTVADRENNTRYLLDVEELQQLTEEATQQGLFEPLNLSANYIMNGTETIVSSGIILDVSGFQALEEEGEEEVSAANITTTTATNTTDSNSVAITEEGGVVEFQPIPYPILDSFTLTFEEPGTYEYFCAFHPGMWGVVTVAEEEEVAGEEEEVSAANITTTTATNATDSNATAVVTTPIPPTETRQENTTTTTEGEEDGGEE